VPAARGRSSDRKADRQRPSPAAFCPDGARWELRTQGDRPPGRREGLSVDAADHVDRTAMIEAVQEEQR
jgi:hypothetical protein